MEQYRLWLHHRKVKHNLLKQQMTYEQELAEIDAHIARLEKGAMPTNNALLTVLMQHLKLQEQTTSQKTDAILAQPEHKDVMQENMDAQKPQALPPSHHDQQHIPVSPPLLAWSQLPNFNAQEMPISDKQILPAEETVSVLPEAIDDLLPGNLDTFVEYKPQKNIQDPLPWWLYDLTHPSHKELELEQNTLIDQQSTHINQRVERWFARRNTLLHPNKWQEGQEL